MLAQGEKRVYLGDEVHTYDFSQYLVLPVPLPAECEGRTAPGQPILGLSIAVDPMEVGKLVMEMESDPDAAQALPRGLFCAPMHDALYDATFRLVQALAEPRDTQVLAPMIKREILYRVLRGENGGILRGLVHRDRRFFRIAKALRKIHDAYREDFDIGKLAGEAGMSGSTFHSSFKAVTQTSPLQYLKNVRLHKARALMIQDGLNASVAAFQVGYESASQFNREYRRLFGVTPAKDATVLRGRRTEEA
jgi:AraC-like DNA-binding protein